MRLEHMKILEPYLRQGIDGDEEGASSSLVTKAYLDSAVLRTLQEAGITRGMIESETFYQGPYG
jgi:hypothetical protein